MSPAFYVGKRAAMRTHSNDEARQRNRLKRLDGLLVEISGIVPAIKLRATV